MLNIDWTRLEEKQKWIEESLVKKLSYLPKAWIKWIAYYYPNAKVRKVFWNKLGVIMEEDTYSNIGMIAVLGHRAKVYIGKRVSIAPNVIFVASSGPNNSKYLQEMGYVSKLIKEEDIFVEDDVWIGASATILPGVRIGTCSVIGAGSVVVEDVEPYCIYAGVPARKIRDIRTGERIYE